MLGRPGFFAGANAQTLYTLEAVERAGWLPPESTRWVKATAYQ